MSTITEAPLAVPVVSHVPWWRGKIVQVGAIIAVMWLAYRGWKSEYPWPNDLVWNGLQAKFDSIQTYLIDQRLEGGGGLLFTLFDGFRIFADNLVTWFNDLLIWLTWIGTTVAGTLLSWRFGGLRAGVWALAAFASFAVSGLWAESMETLALMLAAVGLSILIGVPLGIAAGRSRRFNRILTPFLDAAQIVPAFAYLMPVVLFFSIGYAAAVVATMIYAIPPCIRITALGIRRVPVNTVEAAASMGATGRQMLLKVQLPMSRRMLLLGLNQTILFALSMVVIAGLIGGGGLGAVVNSGLFSNPALAILAGVVIVVMAMAFDRITEAIADRTDPTKRHLDAAAKRRLRVESLVVTAAIVGTVVVAKAIGVSGAFPQAAGVRQRAVTAQEWLLAQIQKVLDYVQDPTSFVFHITEPIGNFILVHLLLPLQAFLMEAPWFTTLAGLTLIAFVISGLRPAITAFLMLALIGFMGVWSLAMDTLSQVIVATVIAVILGFGLGIWASESRTVSGVMRPVNDVLQTLPQLVYIIPFIYLMPVSIVPGIVAAVLYAFPVVVRLVERGLKDVAPESRRGGRCVRGDPRSDSSQGEDPPRRRHDHARCQPGDHHGARRRRDRRARRIGRPRVRGRAGARPRPVRTGRDRVDRHPGARHHARSSHAGRTAGEEGGHGVRLRVNVKDKEGRMSESTAGQGDRPRNNRRRCGGGARRRCSGFGRRHAAGGVRHGDLERELVGGLDGERLRRQERPREEAQVLGQGDEHHREPAELPGDGRRQDRRRARGLGQHARPVEQEVPDEQVRRPGRRQRDHRRHRLVHPALPAQAVPAVQDVEGAQGQGERLQDARVVSERRDVPRRRPVVRPEGPRAHQGARPEPEARRLGSRAGAGRALDAALQAAQAGAVLLVRPAVPERGRTTCTASSCPSGSRAASTTRS